MFFSWHVDNGLVGSGGCCASGNNTLCAPPNNLSLMVIASARRGPTYSLSGGSEDCVDSGLKICAAVLEVDGSRGRSGTLDSGRPVGTGRSRDTCGPDGTFWER